MNREWLARILVIIGLSLVVTIPLYGRLQPAKAGGIVLHARLAEKGGWTPANLAAQVGQPIHLSLTSDDVTHGFAIGKLDQPAVDVNPGEMTNITVVFSRPGKYTFYCTRWCGVNHWRMRGTIEVTGSTSIATPSKSPAYINLGIDIDSSHSAQITPAQPPSAQRAAQLNQVIPPAFQSRDYYLSHTPQDLWLALRADSAYTHLSDQDVWDIVAWVWRGNTTPAELLAGERLFAANCAACHGESGGGDGVFARQLATASDLSMLGMGEYTQLPADFSDPSRMLSASPALLQGKILRGGMGTGMPSWGAIFTEDQTWALVAYLWTFQFNMEDYP